MVLFSHGFLILDKPVGISSAKAVAQVKHLLQCRKIGHGGTLDPLASGVLPLAIGEATKAFDYVASAVKEYRFTITFGEERTTDDAEGEVSHTTSVIPTIEDIMRALPDFTGTVMQAPPAYSALKINGKRAYKLARSGENPEMLPRPVEIHNIKLISFLEGGEHRSSPSLTLTPSKGVVADAPPRSLAPTSSPLATLEVTCGKGTYIRSLARDIARKCNSLGYVSMLRRISVSKFHEKDAISLDKLEESVHNAAPLKAWVPIELALDDIPAIDLGPHQARALRQGKILRMPLADGKYMALHQGSIVALTEIKSNVLRVMRVFNID